jgi:hypothetical protein
VLREAAGEAYLRPLSSFHFRRIEMATKRRSAGSPSARTVRQIRSLLGQKTGSLEKLSVEALAGRGREPLLGAARLLGLSGVSRLRLKELATRVQKALRASAPPREEPADAGERAARSKFELGGAAERPAPQHIPWSYGQDRVTAMAVDPDRMFVYWEVRDDSIEAARRNLGKGGPGAWLDLRVYDVTHRIFDGTNAHRYFDVKVERSDRQWFVHVAQPASTWCVELGLKSHEGYFQRVVRSGRVDFPRRGAAPRGPVQWMTVRVQTGEASGPFAGAAVGVSPSPPPPPLPAVAAPRAHLFGLVAREAREEVALTRETVETRSWEEWRDVRSEWSSEGERLEWVGPVTRTSWEAGPFPVPVAPPPYSEERWQFEGPVKVDEFDGGTRVTYGPWQVVIRGIDAHAERHVLATWQLETSWVTAMGRERALELVRHGIRPADPGGASEGLQAGASERLWARGSETRLRGASELFALGASERLYGGASELVYRGASEWRYRGASERLLLGASEQLQLGASEQTYQGGSEARLGGASEAQWPGGSEQRLPPSRP